MQSCYMLIELATVEVILHRPDNRWVVWGFVWPTHLQVGQVKQLSWWWWQLMCKAIASIQKKTGRQTHNTMHSMQTRGFIYYHCSVHKHMLTLTSQSPRTARRHPQKARRRPPWSKTNGDATPPWNSPHTVLFVEKPMASSVQLWLILVGGEG